MFNGEKTTWNKKSKQTRTDCAGIDWDRRQFTQEERCILLAALKNDKDEDIIRSVVKNPQVLSCIFWFEVYSKNRNKTDIDKEVLCSCFRDMELCQKDFVTRGEMIKRLEMAITSTKCPHVCFEINNIPFTTEQDITCDEWSSKCDVTMPTYNVCRHTQKRTAGVYWIHIALLFERSEVIKQILPFAIKCELPSVAYYTLSHHFSVPYLSLVHHNLEVAKFFINNFPSNVLHNSSYDMLPYSLSNYYFDIFKILYGTLKDKCAYELDSICSLWSSKVLELFDSRNLEDAKTLLSTRKLGLRFYFLLFQEMYERQEEEYWMYEMICSVSDLKQILIQNKKKHKNKHHQKENILDEILIKAVLTGKSEIVKLFIDNGFNASAEFNSQNILYWADALGYSDMSRTIKQTGVYDNFNRKYPHDPCKSPLTLIVQYNLNQDFKGNFFPLPIVHRFCEIQTENLGDRQALSASWNQEPGVFHYLLLLGVDVTYVAHTIFSSNSYERIPEFIYHLITTNTRVAVREESQLFFLMNFKGLDFVVEDDVNAMNVALELAYSFITETGMNCACEHIRSIFREVPDRVKRFQEMLTNMIIQRVQLQSLSFRCRLTLRDHFKGIQYLRYLQAKHKEIPNKILKYLQHEDILKDILTEKYLEDMTTKLRYARGLFNLK